GEVRGVLHHHDAEVAGTRQQVVAQAVAVLEAQAALAPLLGRGDRRHRVEHRLRGGVAGDVQQRLVVAGDDLAQQSFDLAAAEVQVPVRLRLRIRRAGRGAELDRGAVEDPLGAGDVDAWRAGDVARQVRALHR